MHTHIDIAYSMNEHQRYAQSSLSEVNVNFQIRSIVMFTILHLFYTNGLTLDEFLNPESFKV